MPDDLSPSSPNTARALGVPLPGAAAEAVAPGLSRGRRKRISPESALQRSVIRYLSFALPKHEAIYFAVPNGGLRDVRVAQHLKAEGLTPGVADIMIIWRGRAIGIELKAEKGRLSENQKAWADQFTLAGGVYKVCRSIEEVEDFLGAAGMDLRARHKSKAIAAGRSPAE